MIVVAKRLTRSLSISPNKGKLEQLKQDQEQGKTLNEDQRKAIKRFDQVIELLDFFKEFNKSIATIFTDVSTDFRVQPSINT